MHLHELMGWPGPMTSRQMEAWLAWMDADEERPGRTEWYLMQIAAEIRRAQGRSASINDMRIRFERGGGTRQPGEWRITDQEREDGAVYSALARLPRERWPDELRRLGRPELAEKFEGRLRARARGS